MRFSIIVPTYNRSASLQITLKSILKLDYPDDEFEIIVVDNNSNDGTSGVVEILGSNSHSKLKYIFERKPGVMHARHAGARAARGKILYFVDDDIIVSKNVLKVFEDVFKMDRKIVCVTGKIIPKWEIHPPMWILKYFNNYILSVNNLRKENLLIAPYDVGVFSCHEAIRRKILFKSGGFDPEATGDTWVGDGETGLSIRLEKLGYLFAFTGKSVVYHRISANRENQTYINHRFSNQGRAQSYTDLRKYPQVGFGSILRLLSYINKIFVYILSTVLYFPFSDKWHWTLAGTYYYVARFNYDLRFIMDPGFRKFTMKENWL